VTDGAVVAEGAHLFDDAPQPAASERFVAEPGHHLLFARGDDGAVLGFVSGVETTHPDKGTEMFLYELGVDPAARRQGIGSALVEALAELARSRGCFGMWVGFDADNEAARATYRRTGARDEGPFVMYAWTFPAAAGAGAADAHG